MKIYCRMETGLGKVNIEDRLLVGNTILAGGVYSTEISLEAIPLVIAIADGVGGNSAGNIAAHMAVEGVASMNIPGGLQAGSLSQLISETNIRIVERSKWDRGLHNMATTLSGICHVDGKWLLFHVGNTRVYSWREPYLTQLTTDHSWARNMKMIGWSDEEIQASGRATEINSCLGNGDPATARELQVIDMTSEVENAQMLLLTTDGVHEYIPERALEGSFRSISDVHLYLQQAMAFARENGSTDDLSMTIVDFRAG